MPHEVLTLAQRLRSILSNVPGSRRIARLPRQLVRKSPFSGDVAPARVPLFTFASGRPALPFPHPWNYREPLRILEAFFWNSGASDEKDPHNRYLDVPFFAPVLVTRDPAIIEAISVDTGDKPGQFDRSTLPSAGIARATGSDSLLYANGPLWKRQKQLSAPPFSRNTLFQPEQFDSFADTFRHTVDHRLHALDALVDDPHGKWVQVELVPEIKAVMLEMLVNNFFGADISYEDIRERYVPAIDCVIEHIVRDTVINRLGIPLGWLPAATRRAREAKRSRKVFEELTDIVLAMRKDQRALWAQFRSDAPDEALRSNIRVFLAGALEATTSFASWAIAHLARNTAAQQKLFNEVCDVDRYTPDVLTEARYLNFVLDETLRLTPALYFHPRRSTADTWVDVPDRRRLRIPAGTHILLDVWHANRHEGHWGVEQTGHPAEAFVPERWETLASRERTKGSKRWLHFGFGHGPRFCPGKNLGQLEVALVVGAFVKLFEFRAVRADCDAVAGVSTRPSDGCLVELRRRAAADTS